MQAGSTLLVERPGTSYDSHLWIVISDPTLAPDQIVIVNLTSWRADKDQACILRPGDHRYVTRKTCVNYRDAKIQSLDSLESLISSGTVKHLDDCTPELLQRIRAGVWLSRMPLDTVAILIEQGVIEDS